MDRIAQEEIFGPVLSVVPVDDYAAAVTALNQVRYGLSSSIFTRDVNAAFRAMRDFETGIVYVNAGTIGHVALDTFTEWKSIYVDYSRRLTAPRSTTRNILGLMGLAGASPRPSESRSVFAPEVATHSLI